MAGSLQLSYISGGVAIYPPGSTFGPRKLSDFEIVWIMAGQVVYRADGVTHDAPPGTMLINRPGVLESYQFDPANQSRHAFFHTSFESIPADWPRFEDWPIAIAMPNDDIVRPLFRYLLGQVARVKRSTPPTSVHRAVELLMSALLVGPQGQALESFSEYPAPVLRALAFTRDRIESDPAGKISLDQLADAASVSREHLCRLFRQAFDTTPANVVWMYRLEMAMDLMMRTNMGLKEIAHQCGFSNQYHFSRRFRTVYGAPPSELRAKLSRGAEPPLTRLVRQVRLMPPGESLDG